MMRSLSGLVLATALSLLSPAAQAQSSPDAGPSGEATAPVTIDTGTLTGRSLPSGIRQYLGIPFAEPPVGNLRWHAPVPVRSWQGVRSMDTPHGPCPQPPQGTASKEKMSEDCLTLNVWVPAGTKPGSKLPVAVWIHGGGFYGGWPNEGRSAGTAIVEKGVVFVAISYRLGVLGFMAHPEATAESGRDASGNWAIMDQIEALKWIKRNIAAFGGDPANVTIFGESAGSESVSLLQATPLAKGLFTRAAGFSGALIPPGNQFMPTRHIAEKQAGELQKKLGATSLAELRAMPFEKIIAAVGNLRVRRPIVDGYVFPQLPIDIFRAGKQNDVPLYVSSTANDKGFSPDFYDVGTVEDFRTIAKQQFGDASEQFFQLFPVVTDADAVKQSRAVIAGNGFAVVNRDWARAQAITGRQPAYLAQFAHVPPRAADPGPFAIGAGHGNDVVYWFGTLDSEPTAKWQPWDRQLSAIMVDSFVSFIKTGNPNTDKVQVPRYDPAHEQRIVFGDKIWIDTLDTRQIEWLRAHPTAGSQQ